jgi:hypothetical protein
MDSVERLAHAINVYRDSCGTLWVDGPVNRALKLESAECRDYVTEKLLKELGCKPTKQVIDVLISKLRNTARAGPTVEVPIRVAAIRAGSGFDLASGDKIILDLADLQGRVVEISLQGAQLTTYRRVFGVNYSSRSATTISPYQRQLQAWRSAPALLHWCWPEQRIRLCRDAT